MATKKDNKDSEAHVTPGATSIILGYVATGIICITIMVRSFKKKD
jgi:hypothetical protein